jgi:hypothetical protein
VLLHTRKNSILIRITLGLPLLPILTSDISTGDISISDISIGSKGSRKSFEGTPKIELL